MEAYYMENLLILNETRSRSPNTLAHPLNLALMIVHEKEN